MQLKNRKPLGLEALEDRWVPATVRFDGSNLVVSNPLLTAGASKISVIESLKGTVESFQVLDGPGGTNNGSFAVTGNITITGNNAADTIAVKVDATGGLPGNLTITAGNGANGITIDSTAKGGFISGNTHVTVGNNANTVTVGGVGGVGVTNKGSLSVNSLGHGNNSITIGGSANPTSVLGNTQISGFPLVVLGGTTGDAFAGNVNIANSSNGLPSTIQLNTGATISGNFTVQGGTAATVLKLNGTVLGFNSFNLGNGNNAVTVAGGTTNVTLGNLYLTEGNGNNTLTFNGGKATTVLGNVYVNSGNGANVLGSSTGLTVNGNVFVNNGNGGLTANGTGTSGTFQGNVFGNIGINTGNGTNAFTLDGVNGGNVLGTFNYTGGNGGNNVTVTTVAADLFTLNVRLGNSLGTGTTGNVFMIGTGVGVGFAPGTLTGSVSWGIATAVNAGVNAYVDNGYIWQNAVQLINVPS